MESLQSNPQEGLIMDTLPTELLLQIIGCLPIEDIKVLRLVHPHFSNIILEDKAISRKLFRYINLSFYDYPDESERLVALVKGLREKKFSDRFLAIQEELNIYMSRDDFTFDALRECKPSEGVNSFCNLRTLFIRISMWSRNRLMVSALSAKNLLEELCNRPKRIYMEVWIEGLELNSHTLILDGINEVNALMLDLAVAETLPGRSEYLECFNFKMAMTLARCSNSIKSFQLFSTARTHPCEMSKVISLVDHDKLESLASLEVHHDIGEWSLDAAKKLPNLKVLNYHHKGKLPVKQSLWSVFQQLQQPIPEMELHTIENRLIDYLSGGFNSGCLTSLILWIQKPYEPDLINRFWTEVIPHTHQSLKALWITVVFCEIQQKTSDPSYVLDWCLPEFNSYNTEPSHFNFPSLESIVFMTPFDPNGSFLRNATRIFGNSRKLRVISAWIIHNDSLVPSFSPEQQHQFVNTISGENITTYWSCREGTRMRTCHCCCVEELIYPGTEFRWSLASSSWRKYEDIEDPDFSIGEA